MPKKRKPTHPGEILLEEFLKPMNISQAKFARHLGGTWTYAKLNEIVHGKRGITTDTAIDLAMALGTTPIFWLNLQLQCDLWEAAQYKRRIEPLNPSSAKMGWRFQWIFDSKALTKSKS